MNKNNFENWKESVERWRIKYGGSSIAGNLANASNNRVFNPTSIVAVKACRKCGAKRRHMSRHHKGHEYLFACILEERFAARYIQFHTDDVDWLCDRCHTRAHVVISHIVIEVYEYLDKCLDRNKAPTYEKLEAFRLKIIRCYEVWVNYKKKRKRKNAKSTRKQRSDHANLRS